MPGMAGTMREFSEGGLHSGSRHGPVVRNRAQAIAIGLSEERKMGRKVPRRKRKRGGLLDRAHEMMRGHG